MDPTTQVILAVVGLLTTLATAVVSLGGSVWFVCTKIGVWVAEHILPMIKAQNAMIVKIDQEIPKVSEAIVASTKSMEKLEVTQKQQCETQDLHSKLLLKQGERLDNHHDLLTDILIRIGTSGSHDVPTEPSP